MGPEDHFLDLTIQENKEVSQSSNNNEKNSSDLIIGVTDVESFIFKKDVYRIQ